jgi:transcriptional regulator with XRE-family HTH domain
MANREKELRQEISTRFRRMRKALGRTQDHIADRLGVIRQTYSRYETGKLVPGISTMELLAKRFNISLDWLLVNRGPVFYQEKTKAPPPGPQPKAAPPTEIPKEEQELLDHMARIPMLRHKMLLFFQEFKLEHKELIESAIKENPDVREPS